MQGPLRVSILATHSPGFVRWFYDRRPGLSERSYGEQLSALLAEGTSIAGPYADALAARGHKVAVHFAGCPPLSRARDREHGVVRKGGYDAETAAHVEHVESFSPDVLLVLDMNWRDAQHYRRMRHNASMIVGQSAYPLHPGFDYGGYDLVVSSLPHYVDMFRSLGVASELLPLGFDDRALADLRAQPRVHDGAFVGSFTHYHGAASALLEALAHTGQVEFWGEGIEALPRSSAVRAWARGEAWGLEALRIYARARIVVNRHIDLAGDHANNLRMYEATGAGAMLLTDAKSDLARYFEPGVELVAYRNVNECIELLQRYLADADARASIAAAGQQRTLRDHTIPTRMAQLEAILRERLVARRREQSPIYVGTRGLRGRLTGLAYRRAGPLARALPPPLLRAAKRVYARLRG